MTATTPILLKSIYNVLREFCYVESERLDDYDALSMAIDYPEMVKEAIETWDLIQSGNTQEIEDLTNLSMFLGWGAIRIAEKWGLGRNGCVYFADWVTQAFTGISVDLMIPDASLGRQRRETLRNMNAVAAQAAVGNAGAFEAQISAENAQTWLESYSMATPSVLLACQHAEELDGSL